MSSVQEFMDRFRFNPARAFYVGVERECFVIDRTGMVVPRAQQVLAHIEFEEAHSELRRFVGYELSACQVETRTKPSLVDELGAELSWQAMDLARAMGSLDLSPLYEEVAPASMPLDVYPDPSRRYAAISQSMPSSPSRGLSSDRHPCSRRNA